MKQVQPPLDFLAVAISGLCAVHCLLLPVVLIAFPILGVGILSDEMFHQLLLWAVLPTSVLAVVLARFGHPDVWVVVLVTLGLATLTLGALWAHDNAAPWVDKALSLSGGAVLAIGHLRNFQLCRTGNQ